MKFEKFNSGSLTQRYQYKSFEPSLINHSWRWDDPTINTLLESANRALGKLDAFSLIVPNVNLFIRMHIIKEAQKSSKIEGTQTGMDEAVMRKEEIQPEKRDDWQEVQNYVNGINQAITELESTPLSNRLLKNIHCTLMKGVRGETKQPGEFRITQNWIGGSSLSDAVFIPPHSDNVIDLMSDLESFWHNEEIDVPDLIRIAISHYQFETIHPFLDGNGRIGRLLIPLYLISKGILNKPSLYLSDFFERNRASYYDALMRVRTSNDIIHWVKFFLTGVCETANKGVTVFTSILDLKNEVEKQIITLGKRTKSAKETLDFLYMSPIVSAGSLSDYLKISQPTAYSLIKALINLNILEDFGKIRGSKFFIFKKYFDLF